MNTQSPPSWFPKYRVGQTLSIKANVVGNAPTLCKVIYPYENGTYFVRFVKTQNAPIDGYDIVPEMYLDGDNELTGEINRGQIRVAFFGNGAFALPTLKTLVENGYDVCAVITTPDKPSGRGRTLRPSPIKEFANNYKIPILQPYKLDGHFFQQKLKELNPTLGVVVEFRILPKSTFSIPKWGCINLHSALLPEFRGASTIHSALKSGNQTTGATVFKITESIDSGDIINNLCVKISDDDNAGTIHHKLKSIGARLVDDAIQRIALDCAAIPQTEMTNDFLQPSYAPKLTKKDFEIPWHKQAECVNNHIRSLSPHPGARTSFHPLDNDKPILIKILSGCVTDIPRCELAPSEFRIENQQLLIACQDFMYSVSSMQPPGKKEMSASDFINGFRGIGRGFCEYTAI